MCLVHVHSQPENESEKLTRISIHLWICWGDPHNRDYESIWEMFFLKFHLVSAAVFKVAADVQCITLKYYGSYIRLHILKASLCTMLNILAKDIWWLPEGSGSWRWSQRENQQRGPQSTLAWDRTAPWSLGDKQRTESSVQPRYENVNEVIQTMQLVNGMRASVNLQFLSW